MSDESVPRAAITSFDIRTTELAVLTYTVHGAKCRVGFGLQQIELLRMQVSRVEHAMKTAQAKLLSD